MTSLLPLVLLRCLPVAMLASVLIAPPAQASELAAPAIKAGLSNPVPACATPGRLMAYLQSRNPRIEPRFWGLGIHYMRFGQAMGIRWDYAFFQMIVETRSLEFRRPDGQSANVKSQQNNFAGLGATGGVAGESFPDVAAGVKAHLEHVLLYAGEPVAAPVAERTRQVQAWGILRPWQMALQRPVTFADLAQRWAAGDRSYGPSIQSVANRFYESFCQQPDPVPEQVAEAMRGARPILAADAEGAQSKPGAALAKAAIERARASGDASRAGLGAPMDNAGISAAAATVVPSQPALVPAALTPPAPPAPAPPPVETADDAVRSLVGGKTVALDTPLGTTIPIAFREDGTMSGKAGSLAGMLGAAADSGRWWAERGRLCQKWGVWFNTEVQCLKLRLSRGMVHWTRDDGRTGTARIVSN